MNRRGFIAGMLAAPFVAKAELLMPVQKVVVPEKTFTVTEHWFELESNPLLYRLGKIWIADGRNPPVLLHDGGGREIVFSGH
jgi:hypothetical protein